MTGLRCLLAAALWLWPASGGAQTRVPPDVETNRRDFPPDSSQHRILPSVCPTGTETVLELDGLSRSLRHNGNDGEAHLVLRDKKTRKVLWSGTYVGEGICLGFNPHIRRYIFGIRQEHGIGSRLVETYYVGEIDRKAQASAFTKGAIEAFAAVPGPDRHYVAFIALEGNDTSLFVLDVEKDSLRKLGKAPLPPPLTPTERDYVKQHPDVLEGPWEWMASFRDGYMELDPGIVTFRGPATLDVSYGSDTARGRAAERTVATYDLGH